jgi:hypothetical protein
MGILSALDSVASLVPGYQTAKGAMKGLFQDGITGVLKGALKGFSNDWMLGIVSMFVPGAQAISLCQLGVWGADACTGVLDSKHEGRAQQYARDRVREKFPNGSPGYW